MRCRDCRFTLLCYMGRLGAAPKGEPQGTTQLCPLCGKFIYSPSYDEDPSTYVFLCEQRPVTPAIKKEWDQLKARIANDERNRTAVATIMVRDPGPGLPRSRAGEGRDLRVAECLACCHQLGMAPGIIWHDLDEDDCLRMERQPHAFGLRNKK